MKKFCNKRATLKTYNFFAAEQAFLPVHDKGQTEMSDPPNLINHNGRSLIIVVATVFVLFSLTSAMAEDPVIWPVFSYPPVFIMGKKKNCPGWELT